MRSRRAERGAVPGEHDGAHFIHVAERAEGASQFGDDGFVEGIANVRAVQRDGCRHAGRW
ncbi:hypothetical protein AWV80_15305 [Cupriavidus sp. UYMU48A]|nr:hypothetical protein AWV80_15305 [Cupriavidus sp. UYMU48A]